MKTMKLILCTCLILAYSLISRSQDVSSLIAQVNQDTIVRTVRELSGEDPVIINGETELIRSRSNTIDRGVGNDLAADYIKERLTKYGLEVVDQSFGTDGRNIIAIQTGINVPDSIYIICAHYDAVSYHCADDNASGDAAVIEAARILSPYCFDYTIIYALWDHEEDGLQGSRYYAQMAYSSGMKIAGVINLEMLGYDSNDNGEFEIHVDGEPLSMLLNDEIVNTVNNYDLSLDPFIVNPSDPNTANSDHCSFWEKGYGALCVSQLFFNGDDDPYYHTSNDRISNFNLNYFTKLTQLVTGTLATLAGMAACPPSNYGDFRSAGTGNWNDTDTWKWYDGEKWVPASAIPTDTDGRITIGYGHTITVTENISVDQVFVSYGGKVSVASDVTLTVADGSEEEDFLVNGYGKVENSGTIDADGMLIFDCNSEYEHVRDGGSIPVATWTDYSNCVISGIESNGLNIPQETQPFGNFIWNCSSQNQDIDLHSQLTSVAGDFIVTSTNSRSLLLTGTNIVCNLTVGSDYIQSGSSTTVYITKGSFVGVMSVGNFNLNGGTFVISGSLGTGILNVRGDLSLTGGTLNMSQSSADGILNSKGDFLLTAGTITENLSASGVGEVDFIGEAIQNYASGNVSITNIINFCVLDGSWLQMATANTRILGSGTFTLSSGGSLGITSSAGITLSGSTGNIQCCGVRSYSTGANYIYNGTVSQSTGNGVPTGLTGKLTINNGGTYNTVTLNSAFAVASGGSVDIVNGIFAAGTNLTLSAGSVINRRGGMMTGTPSGVYDVHYSGDDMVTTSEVTGSGLNNVTVAMSSGQTLMLGQYVVPDGDLTVLSGTFDLGENTFDRSASGGILTVHDGAELKIGCIYTLPSNYDTYSLGVTSTVEYNGGAQSIYPATYGNLTLSGTGTKIIQAGSSVTVNGTLTTGNLLTIESSGLTSSGSLIVCGSSVGNVTYNRQMPASLYRYISSPVNSASLPPGRTYWIWDEPTGDWLTTTSYEAGRGYTMLAEDNKVTFTGTVVTSASIPGTAPYYSPGPPYTLDRSVWGGGGWNLLGNPFTSAMSGTSFISANTTKLDASYQALYVYDGTGYKYVASTEPGFPLGSSFGEYVQAGQGFFVLAKQDGVNFSFASGMQMHQTSVPMTKSAGVPWPGLQLKVQYGDKENSTMIVYNENMTAGLDPGYDIGLLSSGADIEIYTALVLDNGVNFARQALPMDSYDENVIPVGIISGKGGQVTFSADVVPLNHLRFYLEDRESGIITDLNKDSYTALLTPKISGTGRFFIHPSSRRILSPVRDNDQTLNLRIWASHNQVHIEGPVSENATCSIYDLSGRKYKEVRLTDAGHNYVTMSSATHGIFVVNVIDGERIISGKVLIP
jgi:hypothetical protein